MATASQTMLAAVTTAYQECLLGKVVHFDGRRYESHDIKALGEELTKWQRIVASESSTSLTGSARYTRAVFND